MLDFCGMDPKTYSETIAGWSSYPNTPDSLSLGANGMKYTCNAINARDSLIQIKDWTINGDQLVSDLAFTGNISGKTIVCAGETSVVYGFPEIENLELYLWTLPNKKIITSTEPNITIDFDSTAFSGEIKVKGINSCGESNEISLPITVNPIPGPAFGISGKEAVCQGETTLVYSTQEIGNVDSYQWTLPNGEFITSTEPNINIDFDSTAVSGELKVKGINYCGVSNEASLSIAVDPIPGTPVISMSNGMLVSNALEGNQWYNLDDSIENATDSIYAFIEDGDYYVIVNLKGCSSLPSNTINVVGNSIETLMNGISIRVYPNPVSNRLTIKVDRNNVPLNYQIINSLGKAIIKGSFIEETNISTENLIPGVYFIKLGNEGIFEFRKVLKN